MGTICPTGKIERGEGLSVCHQLITSGMRKRGGNPTKPRGKSLTQDGKKKKNPVVRHPGKKKKKRRRASGGGGEHGGG